MLNSCDIERIPETTVTDANFWNTTADLRMACNYFYTTLPGLGTSEVTQENWSTFGYPNSTSNNISDGSRVTPATSSDYSYYVIFQANKVIEKSKEVLAKGGSENQVNWYVAEARFFRAWQYFEMFMRFGGVPIIDKTMGVADPDIFKARATRDELIDFIYADLDFAIANLRTADQINSASEYGRISKTAALAFKSRVALFEGTRAKYHQTGDFLKHLNLAKDAAKEVIDSKQHAVFSTPNTNASGLKTNDAYFNLFQIAGEGRANKENIIVRAYGSTLENRVSTNSIQRTYEGNNIVATQNFVDNYLMADGLPISKSPLYKKPSATMTHAEYFEGKDPRMSFTIFKRGDEYITSSNYTIPNPSMQRSGYAIRKYANKEYWQLSASLIDRPVLRYAEVLLNYIEALYEINGSVTDDELNQTINLLRDRLPEVNIGSKEAPKYVSLPKITNSFVNTNGLSMLTEIRRERAVELAFEGFSYWDLIRWKTAETELTKDILGSYLFTEYTTASGADKWNANTAVNNDKFIILQPASLRKFNAVKDYLWPLPINEIAKNPAIIQNPGWEQ